MAECSEIALMLGAFEDGELEPHEYQSVALHLAHCDRCTAELAEYSAIGRELRTAVAEPELAGFAAGVMRRIDSLPVPFSTRVSRFMSRLGEQFGSGFGMATAAAVAAIITVILASPFARNLEQNASTLPQLASRQVAKVEQSVEQSAEQAPVQLASAPGDMNATAEDSQAVISRLESEIPSVAVWSEPQNDTTVIWLPDQQQ
jgi:anti-sigma factor RsiW